MLGRWSVVVVAMAGGLLNSCGSACTLMDCMNSARLVLRSPDGSWSSGEYTFVVTVAGQTHACSVRSPDDFPVEPFRTAQLSCSPHLDFQLQVETIATETHGPNGSGITFTPIPGHWYFDAPLGGTPSNISVLVERDGTELLRAMRSFDYSDYSPNGEACGPTCRRASVELLVPASGT